MLTVLRGLRHLVSQQSAAFARLLRLAPPHVLWRMMAAGRRALCEVPAWINQPMRDEAVFGYGVPPDVAPKLGLPVGWQPTYSDLLAALAYATPAPIRYLEIGVSVGKNFLQLERNLRGAELTAFDIEKPAVALLGGLGPPVSLDRWPSPARSLKRDAASLCAFATTGRANVCHYVNADVCDDQAWRRLQDRRYNLVFSDALHEKHAVVHETRMLLAHRLLDPLGFSIIWDDLGCELNSAFAECCQLIAEGFPGEPRHWEKYTLSIHGWLGRNERPHLVGVLRHRPAAPGPDVSAASSDKTRR